MTLHFSRTSLLFLMVVLALPGHAQDPEISDVAQFDEPWSLAEMPDGRLLVTEKKGNLFIVEPNGEKSRPARGLPDVHYGNQGGLGDVVLHPDFDNNGIIYISYAESGPGGTSGAVVARGRLDDSGRSPTLRNLEVIWRQYPKRFGQGHYSHRLMFDEDGYLWITSGDRQQFTPAQDMQSNMGKVLRLKDDGGVPEDNPFINHYRDDAKMYSVGVFEQIWSLGHRNPLGIALDAQQRIWVVEMGPKGGDELNLIERGANYGYPVVSNGDHYDGRDIPDHDTRPEFRAPALWWTPVISPADMVIYRGEAFANWQDDALIAGLSSRGIVRVKLHADGSASEVERIDMGARIRALEVASGGGLWVLEDDRGDSRGRLLKLTPKQ